MDETPEELEVIRGEAAAIDVHHYRKRYRALAAVGVGALGAAAVWLVLHMVDDRRNPCERVRDFVCGRSPGSPDCALYESAFKDSVDPESPKMRGLVRGQCATKIESLKADGTTVR